VIQSLCKASSQLTIEELNKLLDDFAASSSNYISTFRRIFSLSNA
jgi:hypothetical protein